MKYLPTLIIAAILIHLPGTSWAATKTWVGTSADMSVGANWSPAGVPSAAASDDMLFDGSSTFNSPTFPGGTFSANPGLGDITVNSSQTAALSITNSGAAASVFRLANDSAITIDAGAGAYSMGTSGASFFLNLGSAGAGNPLTNNSGNLATIGSVVSINASGGSGGLPIFGGSGDWLVSGPITSAVTRGVTKNGAGTLTLSNSSNAYSGATNVNAGTLRSGASATSFPTARRLPSVEREPA